MAGILILFFVVGISSAAVYYSLTPEERADAERLDKILFGLNIS